MPVTINGTTGIAGVDGSASTPSYQGTDTNTGIFFPAADTIAFGEGGAEVMRIDSSGNVGIGTSSPSSKLTVGNNPPVAGAIAAVGSSGGISLALSDNVNSSLYVRNASGGAILGTDSGGNLRFATNGNSSTEERMRIDSSGNVGIGTSSPAIASLASLNVKGNGSNSSIITAQSSDAASSVAIYSGNNSTDNPAVLFQNNLRFGTTTGLGTTGYTERARITSGGALLVGTTAQIFGSDFITNISGTRPLALKNTSSGAGDNSEVIWHVATSGDNRFIEFGTEGTYTIRGSIDYNRAGGQVRYNTTSDYRLKENIVDLPDALQTILQLKPRQFSWKETGNTTTGFIAHELQEVFPDCVSGEKDGIDADGNPRYQGVDTSFLVATLAAAIQELKSELDAAKARIAVLEAK